MLKNKVIAFITLLSFSNAALAGEPLAAGTVLEKDIYAFDQKEATALMERIEELEHKEQILELYKDMELLNNQTISAYQDSIFSKESVILKYQDLTALQDKRIGDLERARKRQNTEKWVFLFIGVGITAGGLIAYDQLSK